MQGLLRIARLSLSHKWFLIGAYACTAGVTAASLFMPHLVGQAIDSLALNLGGGADAFKTSLFLALLVLLANSLRGIFAFGQNYFGECLSQHTVYKLRNRFYDHVQNLSFGFHDKQHTGNLMSRAITDVEAVRMFINAGIVRTPYYIAMFVFAAFLMINLDWKLGIACVAFMPLVAVISGLSKVHLRRIWLRVQEDMSELSNVLQENLTGVKVVRAFAAEEFEKGKFEDKNQKVTRDFIRAERIASLNNASMILVLLAATGIVLWYGGSRVIDGHMSAGQLAQFFLYLQLLVMPVRQAGMMINSFTRALTASVRLFEILDAKSDVQEKHEAISLPRVEGTVKFEKVTFGYTKNSLSLNDIDLEVLPGQSVALLGTPGSGKSTLVNLLSRFYDVNSGEITIDGINVRDVTLKSLHQNIGFVQQDVFLFSASIRDNIAYGKENASMEDVIKAAKIAQLHNQIENFEDGYETILGERGSNLSGGQRQRLSLARAILLDPPILVLDDSTSSVDAQTEELIRIALEEVMCNRTTFIIANRISSVHMADQILVMKNGKIAERGTHSHLVETSPIYREIYDLQLRPQEEVLLDHEVHDIYNRNLA